MCTLSSDEKERIREEQKEKDRRQNCKQHCTKIAQGLDKLDEYSSSRAIWELVQNARDLSSECEIKITLTENEFVFAHKGKPFTYDSLNSLVKQVSSEEKEDENNNAVGQYGTGFITTHSFGRIIKIDGSFEVKKGFYVDIDNFIIDREFNTIDEFIQKMSAQIKCVEEFFASIDFDTTHKDEVRSVFFKKMQTEWVSEFEKYPIIETAKGKLSISQYDKVKVLSEEVAIWLSSAEFQDKYLPAVYNLASKCCNLPFLADILKWSSIIKKWKSEIREYYIGFEDIAKKIDEESDNLRMFLDFIRESKNDKLFNLYAIIPNREGELMKATELRNANDIFGILYESASRIIPKITKSFVKESYSDTYAFSDYTRTNLRNDINSKVSDWKKDFIVRGVIFPVETENNLIAYCSIFCTENGQSQRNKTMPIICKFCGIDYNEKYVPKKDANEPDLFETAFNCLVENEMLKIDQQANNWSDFDLLKDFLVECSTTETFKKDLNSATL